MTTIVVKPQSARALRAQQQSELQVRRERELARALLVPLLPLGREFLRQLGLVPRPWELLARQRALLRLQRQLAPRPWGLLAQRAWLRLRLRLAQELLQRRGRPPALQPSLPPLLLRARLRRELQLRRRVLLRLRRVREPPPSPLRVQLEFPPSLLQPLAQQGPVPPPPFRLLVQQQLVLQPLELRPRVQLRREFPPPLLLLARLVLAPRPSLLLQRVLVRAVFRQFSLTAPFSRNPEPGNGKKE